MSSTSSSSSSERRLHAIAHQLLPSSTSSASSLLPHSTATPPPSLNSPIPASEEAAMYSSRQIPLFSPKFADQGDGQVQTDITIDSVKLHVIPRLSDYCPSPLPSVENRFQRTKMGRIPPPKPPPPTSLAAPADQLGVKSLSAHPEQVTYNQLIHDNEAVLLDIVRRPGLTKAAKAFVRAGPRATIVWKEGEVRAAIATCGGLCPGLNDVIAELFHTLYYGYGVDRIFGIKSGFRGFWDERYRPWKPLTPESVRGIYDMGGTVLGSSRGGFDTDKIIRACQAEGVNQVYIIGGDGTHRAANALYLECRKRKLKMTVAGIPKTIDNDIGVIDRSFGFNTAVAEARKAIQSAVVEASCAPHGLGIVQLMGRHAGYISAHATLASRQVDLCLIPEVPFPLHGPLGVLTLVEEILDRQGYGVIVVAEGAGSDLFKDSEEKDESGNARLPEVGKFLQQQIAQHFRQRNKDVSIKYHDPSYMIRSVPADAGDSVYCFPELDTRVLTDRGLLFLDQIEAYQAMGMPVLFGCYDKVSHKLSYATGNLVCTAPPAELLEFNSAGEAARWTSESGPYGLVGVPKDNPNSRHTSLRVTPNHRMFVQTSHTAKFDRAAPAHEVPASALLSECACRRDRAGKRSCAHSRAHIRLLACAGGGFTPQSSARRQEVQRDLSLNEKQFAAFLELLGFFIGAGTVVYYSDTGMGGGAVGFHQVKDEDRDWLQTMMPKVGLRPSQLTCAMYGIQEHLHIHDQEWFKLFDKEFGAKDEASKHSRRPPSTTGSRRASSRSPPSLHTPSTSMDCAADDNGEDEDEADDLTESDGDGDDEKDEDVAPPTTTMPRGWGITWGPGVLPEFTKSVKHLPDWTLTELSAAELRLVIRGLYRADGGWAGDKKFISTSSARFRDQLMQALLQCGYSAYAKLMYPKGTIRGYVHVNQAKYPKKRSVEFFASLGAEAQLQYKPIQATADVWEVHWTNLNSTGSKGSCWPTVNCQQGISRVPYTKADGRVWCVDVDHPHHLIVAQRAQRDPADGAVTKQSRPIIVGNCMTLAQNAVHGCMAGFTGFTSGLVNNRTVLLPIPAITATSPSYLNPDGRTWERVVSLTHQPMWERMSKAEGKQGKGGKERAAKAAKAAKAPATAAAAPSPKTSDKGKKEGKEEA